MVLTNDKKIFERGRSITNLFFKNPRFIHDEIGSNFRYTNLQAAIGLAQFEILNKTILKKKKNWSFLSRKIKRYQNNLFTFRA